jgi:FixJ family two-component response regulator
MNLPNTAAGGSLVSIVDDHPSFGMSMRRLIASFGFKADISFSAQANLGSRHVEDTVCHLLDLRTPASDGLALQCHLRDTDRLNRPFSLRSTLVLANAGKPCSPERNSR